jgi:uncharacterized membrane protein YqiK
LSSQHTCAPLTMVLSGRLAVNFLLVVVVVVVVVVILVLELLVLVVCCGSYSVGVLVEVVRVGEDRVPVGGRSGACSRHSAGF